MPNQTAPEGQIYVCTACGKCSRDLYGAQTLVRGWDESCTINCALAYEDKITIEHGYIKEATSGSWVQEAAL